MSEGKVDLRDERLAEIPEAAVEAALRAWEFWGRESVDARRAMRKAILAAREESFWAAWREATGLARRQAASRAAAYLIAKARGGGGGGGE